MPRYNRWPDIVAKVQAVLDHSLFVRLVLNLCRISLKLCRNHRIEPHSIDLNFGLVLWPISHFVVLAELRLMEDKCISLRVLNF